MKKSVRIWIASLVLTPCLFVGMWVATYGDYYDPNNIHYVLWKWGIASIDPGRALSIMTHDSNSQRLVVGRTEYELQRKFGYLRSVSEAPPYLRDCYLSSDWKGKTVKFLRDGPYKVVFENGKATDLVLMKPC
jgi:hypothetical protein